MTFLPKTCFFTGHRIINPNDISFIKRCLNEEILNAINNGFTHFITGGALGFDTLAAEQVILMRENYDIRLIIYLPCTNHGQNWGEFERARYERVLSEADEIYYVTKEPYRDGCMKKRNMAMVEASDLCIAFLKNSSSGTAQTVKMAEEKGAKVVNIAKNI